MRAVVLQGTFEVVLMAGGMAVAISDGTAGAMMAVEMARVSTAKEMVTMAGGMHTTAAEMGGAAAAEGEEAAGTQAQTSGGPTP
jgi:hypothetical protein